jgi:hypothetical protein
LVFLFDFHFPSFVSLLRVLQVRRLNLGLAVAFSSVGQAILPVRFSLSSTSLVCCTGGACHSRCSRAANNRFQFDVTASDEF